MIKLDIISGFLGAGKTTFIKKILKACSEANERVVLIENEFGEIGIDGELVKRDGFEVYEISKGCVCCSLKSDFMFTLSEIINKIQPDRILFEPSGIFVLSEIFEIVKSPEIAGKCRLNSIITIVDCINYLKQKNKYTFFFQNQVAHSSMIVLSKIPLASRDDIRRITHDLTTIHPHCDIVATPWNHLTSNMVLQLLDPSMKNLLTQLLNPIDLCVCGSHQHFESLGIKTPKELNPSELCSLLNGLSKSEYGEILRAKGFVKSMGGMYEFNYVNGMYDITECFSEPTPMISFIGIDLNTNLLNGKFLA